MTMEKWARTFSRTQRRTTSLGRPRAALFSFRPFLLSHLLRPGRSRHSSRRSAPDPCVSQELQRRLCCSLVPQLSRRWSLRVPPPTIVIDPCVDSQYVCHHMAKQTLNGRNWGKEKGRPLMTTGHRGCAEECRTGMG